MSQVYFNDPDEATEQALDRVAPDPVSEAVGSRVFVARHRFPELFFSTPMGRSPQLVVSRYYWDATPPTVVDFVGEFSPGEQGKRELAAKREFFKRAGIRYLIARDGLDAEAIAEQVGERVAADEASSAEVKPPRVAPPRRRRRTASQ